MVTDGKDQHGLQGTNVKNLNQSKLFKMHEA